MGGGPCDTSGKQVASCDVNLSNGSLLWKAAPSSPVNKNHHKSLTAFENLTISSRDVPEEENLARDFTVDEKSLVKLYHPKRQNDISE